MPAPHTLHVIRHIDTSEATEATPQAPRPQVPPATPAGGKSFASVLHAKTAESDSATGGKAAPATGHAHSKKLPIETPEHEEWTPVAGHRDYAKISQGPRAGMYINLTRGSRRGQAFRIEHRDGKVLHVYGDGDKKVEVQAGKDKGRVRHGHGAVNGVRPPKGEVWAPVKGANNYADILSGPRNGLYVNTSGGIRNGMAFQIVHHGNRTFHVYGKGKHRQVVEVDVPHKTKHSHHSTDSHGTKSTDGSKTSDGSNAGDTTTGGASPTT